MNALKAKFHKDFEAKSKLFEDQLLQKDHEFELKEKDLQAKLQQQI